MEPLLALAAQLEARDAAVAAALAAVEQLQADLEQVRAQAVAVSTHLAGLPAALAGHARDEEIAADDRATAQAALREAEGQEESPLRDLAMQRAKDAIVDADRRAARAREHQEALAREGAARREEAAQLAARVGVDGLDAVIAWTSHRRGELLVEQSRLARDREAVVREASELLGSVLGDPLAATSVAGLRERLERAFP
jgi:hypothetical protein